MTEHKRFELEYVRGKPNFWDNVVDLADCYLTCEDVVDLLNELNNENEQLKHDATVLIQSNQDYRKENEQLKQALKNSYINEICENCKYGNYFLSDNFDGGFEGDFECLKNHFGNDHWKCDGLTKCDEFELEIKGDVE